MQRVIGYGIATVSSLVGQDGESGWTDAVQGSGGCNCRFSRSSLGVKKAHEKWLRATSLSGETRLIAAYEQWKEVYQREENIYSTLINQAINATVKAKSPSFEKMTETKVTKPSYQTAAQIWNSQLCCASTIRLRQSLNTPWNSQLCVLLPQDYRKACLSLQHHTDTAVDKIFLIKKHWMKHNLKKSASAELVFDRWTFIEFV